MNLSVAMLSVHTCPLAALGGKETGGMNVYVRQVARELGRMGLHVDVFTRSQNPTIPRVVELGPGARVVHLPAGPEAPMPREAIHPHLDQFAAGVEDFARQSGIAYDVIHSHYWLSGVAGLRLREKWSAPLVQMFHTLGRLKNAVAQSPPELEPALRLDEETRIVAEADRVVAANVVERAHLVWHYGARADRISVIPCGVDTDLFQPMDPAKAKDLLELPPDPLLLYVGRMQPIKGLDTLLEAMTKVPVLRRRGRDRGPVALRVVRDGRARGDGVREPGGGLARGRAHHHGAGRGDRPPRARERPGRAGRRDDRAARRPRGPPARPAGHALGGRAPVALRGGGGVPPLRGAAPRRRAASPPGPVPGLELTWPLGAPPP